MYLNVNIYLNVTCYIKKVFAYGVTAATISCYFALSMYSNIIIYGTSIFFNCVLVQFLAPKVMNLMQGKHVIIKLP